jgi:hypothetical protein
VRLFKHPPKTTLPQHLRSYGVWVDKPARKGKKERVWRAESHFGYGPTEPPRQGGIIKRNNDKSSSPQALTLIDDGAILFRHGTSQNVWPGFSPKAPGLYLLKMSWPLCRGDLWTALLPVMKRLMVVVSAVDLRRQDAQINSRLSWEQCAEHTACVLLLGTSKEDTDDPHDRILR